ncbi:MAG TPA: metal-binding protein [Firmicutes bacterium]|nr:metal-binding protein [Bacillota bacterium]
MGRQNLKYRRQKVKREHHLLPGLAPILEEIASHPAVKSIIPARINSAVRGSGVQLFWKYKTPTGVKLLAKAGGGVQEIFVVTGEPETLRKLLEEYK